MNQLFRLRSFLNYQWVSKTKYYLHSPIVYQFYLNVLEGLPNDDLNKIAALRHSLRSNSTSVTVKDLGTGGSSTRVVSELEKNTAVAEKYGVALYRLVKYLKPVSILELGTSIGISSSYMALAASHVPVTTLEGSAELCDIARQNHAALGINNVQVIAGNFDATLTSTLNGMQTLGLVLFDGNHRKGPTLDYFKQCLEKADEHTIFIFDDIYWSKEMNEAWEEIKLHPRITLTLDIFQFGICFFTREKLAKENFVIKVLMRWTLITQIIMINI